MSSAAPLLRTKLRPPVSRRPVVHRAELLRRLAASDVRLVLVAAPAGWGKTTLLRSWCASTSRERPVAWVSLDREDDEPARFWGYVLGALQDAAPEIGTQPAAILQAPGTDVVRDVLPVVVNGLDGVADPPLLVLDDLHLIRDEQIHAGLAVLLDRAPPGLRVAVGTRVDPPLPLARLRAAGELVEIRAAQLSLDADETARLLTESLGLPVSAEQAEMLCDRTEGWAAGLCLAALGAAGHDDPAAFIAGLAGDDRSIVDYLGAEVIDQQEPAMRRFLLETSVLERMCPALCNAVTRRDDAAERLAELERGNAFLVALDGRREWFRYHHLFRDLLRHELRLRDADAAPALHGRAAAWFAEAGLPLEAVGHALAAERPEAAAELVAEHWYAAVMSGGHGLVGRWLEALPGSAPEGDARLAFAAALVQLHRGRLDEAERWAEVAERTPAGGPFHDGLDSGAAGAACARTMARWQRGDLGGASAAARLLADLTSPDSPWRYAALGVIEMARHWRGAPVERSAAGLAAIAEDCRRVAFTTGAVWSLSHLALVRAEAGEHEVARQAANAALACSARHALLEYWVTAAAHVAMAIGLNASGRAEEAAEQAARGLELTRRGSGRLEEAVALMTIAAARTSLGDVDAARRALGEAERVLGGAPDPGTLPTRVAAAWTRLGRRDRGPLDDLSPRELEVLRLLAGELSQREIAASMHVSVNTLKTHVSRIFRKLGVDSRADAVRRANEHDLLRL